MMKLKFEVQYRPHSDTRIALKPLCCGLSGLVVYDDLPKRAIDQLPGGVIVEAAIQLPDQYPVPDPVQQWHAHQEELGRANQNCEDSFKFGQYYVEKGHPLTGQPQYEYWEVHQNGAALPYATFFDNPLLPQSKQRAIEYARELEAEHVRKHGA